MSKFFVIKSNKITGITSNPNTEGLLVPVTTQKYLNRPYWYEYKNGKVELVTARALEELRDNAILKIKSEAFDLISKTDWKLSKAREREDAGWNDLEPVNLILAEREAIRKSSDLAEDRVKQLTDLEELENFSWSVVVDVAPPQRMTHQKFLNRFTQEEMSDIVNASKANGSIATWLMQLELAHVVILTEPSLIMAVQSLELFGLLAEGRADQILAE